MKEVASRACVISQKIELFITTAVIASDPYRLTCYLSGAYRPSHADECIPAGIRTQMRCSTVARTYGVSAA
jgi:hypothetical protein